MNKLGPSAKGVRTTLERVSLAQFQKYMAQNPGATPAAGVRATWAYDQLNNAGFERVNVLKHIEAPIPDDTVLLVEFLRGS